MKYKILLEFPLFRNVWLGELLNVFGNAIFFVSLPLFLLHRTNAAASIGLLLAIFAVGNAVSGLLAGVLADRFRRSRLIIISNLICSIGLFLVIGFGVRSPTFFLGIGPAVLGVGAGLYRPAYAALLPFLVTEDALRSANALRSLANRIGSVLGAAAGGVLSASIGSKLAFWVDVGTFMISILVMLQIHDVTPRKLPGIEPPSLLNDLVNGILYVVSRRWIAAIMLQGAIQIAFVVAPLQILLPMALKASGGIYFGIAVAFEGVGAVFGATYAPYVRQKYLGIVSMLSLAAQLPEIVAIALHSSPTSVVSTCFISGVGLSLFGVIWISQLQALTPREQIGRVLSIDSFANSSLYPIGMVVSGYAISYSGITIVASLASAILFLSIVCIIFVPGVLKFGDPKLSVNATGQGL